MRYVKVRSRNKSANQLRRVIPCRIPTVVRLGSFTENDKIFKQSDLDRNRFREINTVKACKTSNDKYLMKRAFDEHNVKTAKWWTFDNVDEFNENYPLIIKHIHSSKGKGIYYIQNPEEMTEFINSHNDLSNYIIEKYHKFVREYRLHVDKNGCFLTHRKMLKNDATERWHRHHINTVWICEENELFDKPSNWDEIVAECQKAIAAVGLDIGCVDVKVQSNKQEHPDFIILETNSAPALGEETANKYIARITNLL